MENPLAHLLTQIEEQELWQEEIVLDRNEYLVEAGKIDTNLYLVTSGSLRIFLMDEEQEQTIRFGYTNSFFGVLDSYLTNAPTVYFIQAIKKTELKVVSQDTFTTLINSSGKNRQAWNLMLEQLMVQFMQREVDVLTTSPIKRYERLLARSPQVFQEIPAKYIASYLRMTPETLSRLKKS